MAAVPSEHEASVPTIRRTPRSEATGPACKCELPARFSDNRQSTTRHGRLESTRDWLSARRSGEMPGAGVACLLCCTVLFVVDPARHRVTPRCPIRTVTGFDCPGCGGLRAVHELLHLRPAVAPIRIRFSCWPFRWVDGSRLHTPCEPSEDRSFPAGSRRNAPFSACWLPLACYATHRGSREGPGREDPLTPRTRPAPRAS